MVFFEDYFPHSANAFNDPKLNKMIQHEGMRGYGLYWAILEYLRAQPDYTAVLDVETVRFIARRTHTQPQTVMRIVQGYGLFIIDNRRRKKKRISSNGLSIRMKRLDEKREMMAEKARHAAEVKWQKIKGSPDACALQDKSSEDKPSENTPLIPPDRGIKLPSFWEEFTPPDFALNKKTHNWEGLVWVLRDQLHLVHKLVLTEIIELSEFGKIGNPFWLIIAQKDIQVLKGQATPARTLVRALRKAMGKAMDE